MDLVQKEFLVWLSEIKVKRQVRKIEYLGLLELQKCMFHM